MSKLRRWILIIIFFILLILFVSGLFLIDSSREILARRLIGASIAGLFFLWMPLFIYHRWKDRAIKDYMLTEENIKKMRAYTEDKKL